MTELQPLIELSAAQYQAAYDNGMARHARRLERGHRHRNYMPTIANANFNPLGTVGEKAASLFFPHLHWHNEIVDDPTGLPDIGDFIDVKTPQQPRNKPDRQLLGYPDGTRPHWAYLLILPRGERTFQAMGWTWGHILAAAPIEPLQFGRPTHVMPATIPPLYPVLHLQLIASWRR